MGGLHPSRTAGLSQVAAISASAAATNPTTEGSFLTLVIFRGKFQVIFMLIFIPVIPFKDALSCRRSAVIKKCGKSFVLAPQEKLFKQMSVIPTVIKEPAPPPTEAPRASLREETAGTTSRRADR